MAVTTSWLGWWLLIGFLNDRPFIHNVLVWSRDDRSLKPVVSIKEADPQSGIAHRYAWAADSNALLIRGRGRLPEDFDRPLNLCLAYLLDQDELYRLRDCPELPPGECG